MLQTALTHADVLGLNLGIFQSIDRGISWTLLTPPKPKPVRKPVAKKGAKPAAKAKALPKAVPVEAGQELIPALTEKVKVLTHTEDDKNGMFAGTDTGLYRTYDVKTGGKISSAKS